MSLNQPPSIVAPELNIPDRVGGKTRSKAQTINYWEGFNAVLTLIDEREDSISWEEFYKTCRDIEKVGNKFAKS